MFTVHCTTTTKYVQQMHNNNKSEFELSVSLLWKWTISTFVKVFPSQTVMLSWLAVGVPIPRVYTHAIERSRTHVKRSCSPRQSLVEYGKTKRPSMHLIINSGRVGATLLRLAVLGESNLNFLWGKFPLGQQSVHKKRKEKNSQCLFLENWQFPYYFVNVIVDSWKQNRWNLGWPEAGTHHFLRELV